ncbi:hypothetical protein EON65_41355, partial [archaeon]
MLLFLGIGLGLVLIGYAQELKLNYQEYLLLQNIYNAAQGDHWNWHGDDKVIGALPWNFSDYNTHDPCSESWQGVYCMLTNCPPTGCNLIGIDLTRYNLNGTLPDFVGDLPQLRTLQFGENYLRGSLPLLGDTPVLSIFNVSYNFITGTIPDMFHNTPYLETLYLSSNQLAGTIPPSVYSLTRLLYLNLHENNLLDTLPASIANLTMLTYLHVGNNRIFGTVPSELFQLSNISFIFLSYNQLHGHIPSVTTSQLLILRISNNRLTGSIPPTLCNPRIEQISLYNNYLTGSIPQCLSSLPHLELLQVQRNVLRGKLDRVFNRDVQVNLTVVDVSDNSITGTLPDDLFELPSLVNLAAGKNCFHGNLPDGICRASIKLSKVSLDGLAASNLCSQQLFDPFDWFNSRFGGLMQGTIPNCLWSLPALQVVHLSGNGFYGKLPEFGDCTSLVNENELSYCGISSSIKDVVLTHNRLTGTIPNVFQLFPFENLDLSYNKLEGSIERMTNLSFAYTRNSTGATLHLSNNRLTGWVPKQYQDAYGVEILTGNLFSCGSGDDKFAHRVELVKHDPGNQNAICGSEELDGAMISFSLLLATVGCVLATMIFFRFYKDRSIRATKYMYKVLLYVPLYLRKLPSYSNDSYSQYSNVYRLFSILTLIRQLSWLVFGFAILVCLPVYLIFYGMDNGSYSTHANQYTWISSAVFLTGQPPAVGLLFVWSMLVVVVIWTVQKHYDSIGVPLLESSKYSLAYSPGAGSEDYANDEDALLQQSPLSNFMSVQLSANDDEAYGSSDRCSSLQSHRAHCSRIFNWQDVEFWLRHIVVFLANFTVVIGTNAAYLLTQNAQDISSSSKIAVQVLMAGFKLFWNIFMLRVLMTLLPREKHSFKLHVGMLSFNSILAPCIATAFTDSSCLRECFVASSSISSSYDVLGCTESYQYIVSNEDEETQYVTVCTHFETTVFTNNFTPSFIYYYTCSSKLLTAYTPVFVYTYTILLFLLPIFYGSLAMLPRVRFPVWLLTSLDGVLRPQDRGDVSFRKL